MKKQIFMVLILGLILGGCMPGLGSSKAVKQSEFVKGAAVKDFPNLPFYQNAKIIETYGTKDKGFGGSAITKDNIQKVLDFYTKYLGPGGWDNSLTQKDNNNYVYNVKNSTYEGFVIVNLADDGKSTAITLTVSKR